MPFVDLESFTASDLRTSTKVIFDSIDDKEPVIIKSRSRDDFIMMTSNDYVDLLYRAYVAEGK